MFANLPSCIEVIDYSIQSQKHNKSSAVGVFTSAAWRWARNTNTRRFCDQEYSISSNGIAGWMGGVEHGG